MINCDLLVKKAYEGRANAYTPYSNFKVGAAVLTETIQSILVAI